MRSFFSSVFGGSNTRSSKTCEGCTTPFEWWTNGARNSDKGYFIHTYNSDVGIGTENNDIGSLLLLKGRTRWTNYFSRFWRVSGSGGRVVHFFQFIKYLIFYNLQYAMVYANLSMKSYHASMPHSDSKRVH